MYIEKRDNKFYAFLLFFIWPFMSLWFAIINYKATWAKNIIWSFTAFYGYSFAIEEESTSDSTRYIISFQEQVGGTFKDLLNSLYTDNKVDVFRYFIEYIVSRFTEDYRIFFLVIGIIYGYFFSRNIWILLETSGQKLFKQSILIIVIYSFIIPFWQVSGYRWSLAMHVFLFGILQFFILKKKTGLLFSIFSPLIHFSFFLPLVVLFFYLLVGNRTLIYFIFFIFSLSFTEIAGDAFKNSNFLPEFFYERFENYSDENYIERKVKHREKTNWYVRAYGTSLRYVSFFFAIILYIRYINYIRSKKWLFNLFNFILLFYGVANMISPFSSAVRFLALANMLTFAVLFIVVQIFHDKALLKIINYTSPLLFLFLIVKLRVGFNTISTTTLFGSPLIASFMQNDLPLIEWIK